MVSTGSTAEQSPLKVVVWSTGTVGRHAIAGIDAHPDLELVGVWVSHPDKDGKDAGELAELGRELGIAATTDRQALLVVGAIFLGGLIPDITIGRVVINIGGAIIPLILCIVLCAKAGTAKERWRAIAASVLSGGAVYALGRFFPAEPGAMPFEVNYLYGVAAGLIAYLFGRSRRSAFIGGVMGVLLADLTQGIVNTARGITAPIRFGGGGAFDVVIISGLLAVLLAEVIGEIRERMQGGSEKKGKYEFEDGEFVPVKQGGPLDEEE